MTAFVELDRHMETILSRTPAPGRHSPIARRWENKHPGTARFAVPV